MKWFFHLLKAICYLPIKLLFPAKVINGKKIPKKEKIITVSNHLSALDVVIEHANLRGFRHTLAKKELGGKSKFVKKFLEMLGAIYIDRGAADISAMKKVLTVLKNNGGLAIFPEGTRNKNSDEMMPIKEGAAMFAIKSKTTLVPIMIYTKQKLFRKNYIYVGNEFDLSQFYGQKLDSGVLKSASEIIEERMHEAHAELINYVEQKKKKKSKVNKNANSEQ